MQLIELFDPSPRGYHDPKSDQSTLKLDDTRKTRLTLWHLHQLRVGHDARKLEFEKKLQSVSKQYRPPEAAGLGMM
jgi:hypothetical protein